MSIQFEAIDDSVLEILSKFRPVPRGVEMVGADLLWNEGCYGDNASVAVLDTGVDYSHADLENIVAGVDFTGSGTYVDVQGHGTHVAGTIGATGAKKISGVAPHADLYAVKVLGDDGSGQHEWIAQGIEWSIRKKVDIINLSLGSPHDSGLVREAIRKAVDNGIIVIAAAGNSGNDIRQFPAAYGDVISVGAVDFQKDPADFTSLGTANIGGPGVEIMSTHPGNMYARLSGTSMAAPHISGCAALILSKHRKRREREMSMRSLKDMMYWMAKDIDETDAVGYGFFSFDLSQSPRYT